jgi:hypothetical protein
MIGARCSFRSELNPSKSFVFREAAKLSNSAGTAQALAHGRSACGGYVEARYKADRCTPMITGPAGSNNPPRRLDVGIYKLSGCATKSLMRNKSDGAADRSSYTASAKSATADVRNRDRLRYRARCFMDAASCVGPNVTASMNELLRRPTAFSLAKGYENYSKKFKLVPF